ncbi:hypothetical protein [uncultured Algoriphagus sp.]|uniref:hypothetical protein n=1 Tax=uncultured Algoriphagus sp. TaxID=417365 RepID=UPI0030EF3644|tara:strand:+ start:7223 stop:7606 length:384 start_codon:yes stop_codon:yes gene_type:complete
MSFDWNNYVKLGNSLSKQNGEEYKRTAISRIYYGVLNLSREVIKPVSTEKFNRKHIWTQEQFSKYGKPESNQIAAILRRLKKKREKADYENFAADLDKELLFTQIEAKRLQQLIEKFKNNYLDKLNV